VDIDNFLLDRANRDYYLSFCVTCALGKDTRPPDLRLIRWSAIVEADDYQQLPQQVGSGLLAKMMPTATNSEIAGSLRVAPKINL